jgi:DNA-binding MarR family transcriptional regulator
MISSSSPRPPLKSGTTTRKEPGDGNQNNGPVWRLLDNTRFAISRLREIELNQFGLTIEQSSILKILASLGGSSNLGELEYLTLRQPHSLSTLISRMHRLKMVGKKRSASEKRYSIYITNHGQALLDRITENSLSEAFSCLSAKQLADFVRLFVILRSKALDLLRVPFLKYIVRETSGVYTGQMEPWHTISPETAWTLFDGTRFIIARLREIEITQLGITLEQLIVLQTLAENRGAMTTKMLEEATLRQHHSISVLVNRMVKMGLLSKTREAGKNRNTIVISRKGQELQQTITQFSIEMTFAALKTREIERVSRYLQRLHDKARTMLGKPVKFAGQVKL